MPVEERASSSFDGYFAGVERTVIDTGAVDLSAFATVGYRRYDDHGDFGDSSDMSGMVYTAGLRLESDATPGLFLSVEGGYNTIGEDHMEFQVTPGVTLLRF